jgi:hypothetical protein
MMLEAYLSPEDMVPYYNCSDFPFNFGFVGLKEGVTAADVMNNIYDYADSIPDNKVANFVVS